jgi:TatD DNase family protein
VKKPVVVHTRSAKHDTIDIIRAEQSTHGILHCFTEDWETAKAVLDCGYYISFSGIVSLKMRKIYEMSLNKCHLIEY